MVTPRESRKRFSDFLIPVLLASLGGIVTWAGYSVTTAFRDLSTEVRVMGAKLSALESTVSGTQILNSRMNDEITELRAQDQWLFEQIASRRVPSDARVATSDRRQ
jgi:hypothetical protein